jgi:hypothetical protein
VWIDDDATGASMPSSAQERSLVWPVETITVSAERSVGALDERGENEALVEDPTRRETRRH